MPYRSTRRWRYPQKKKKRRMGGRACGARGQGQEDSRISFHTFCKGSTATRTTTLGHRQATLITVQRGLTMSFHARTNAFVRTTIIGDLHAAIRFRRNIHPHGHLSLLGRDTYNPGDMSPVRLPTALPGFQKLTRRSHRGTNDRTHTFSCGFWDGRDPSSARRLSFRCPASPDP